MAWALYGAVGGEENDMLIIALAIKNSRRKKED